jgi:Tfp pilus assembly protein PilO
MGRFIFPIILIAISVISYFTFIDPNYQEIKTLRAQLASYNNALANERQLQTIRNSLTEKRNSMSASDIERLNRLLPDNVNNVGLILDLNALGQPLGMQIQNVKFEVQNNANQQGQDQKLAAQEKKDYGVFNIEFSTIGSYSNFVSFLAQLDKSLRMIDVQSISFNSTDDRTIYRYDFKVKTYWLKN